MSGGRTGVVGLDILARTQRFDARALHAAIVGEWLFRGLDGPVAFDPPAAWSARYAKGARPARRAIGWWIWRLRPPSSPSSLPRCSLTARTERGGPTRGAGPWTESARPRSTHERPWTRTRSRVSRVTTSSLRYGRVALRRCGRVSGEEGAVAPSAHGDGYATDHQRDGPAPRSRRPTGPLAPTCSMPCRRRWTLRVDPPCTRCRRGHRSPAHTRRADSGWGWSLRRVARRPRTCT